MTKVTFKKHPRNTGLSAVGYSRQSVDMKIKKKRFGIIYAPTWMTEDHKWSISIMVTKNSSVDDGNPYCSWMWVKIKTRFDEESDARKWIQENIDEISKKYELRFDDDEQ